MGNFGIQETPKSTFAQEHCSCYTIPMFYRELLTHTACCGADRRTWLWNCLTLKPFKILSHDFALPLTISDLNEERHGSNSENCQTHLLLPLSHLLSLVQDSKHPYTATSHVLCHAHPTALSYTCVCFHGVKPTKGNFIEP